MTASEDIPANDHGGPTTPAIFAKAALRGRLRAVRAAHVASLPPRALADAVDAITRRLCAAAADAVSVGGYVAHRGEPSVHDALTDRRARDAAVALPRIECGVMRFVAWHSDTPLAPGPAGIMQPPAGEDMVPDTLFVPLVGFDRGGARLGQGGGHYDRWLARHPRTQAIGVAWSVQEVATVPADPWDMPLAMIVTETETILP